MTTPRRAKVTANKKLEEPSSSRKDGSARKVVSGYEKMCYMALIDCPMEELMIRHDELKFWGKRAVYQRIFAEDVVMDEIHEVASRTLANSKAFFSPHDYKEVTDEVFLLINEEDELRNEEQSRIDNVNVVSEPQTTSGKSLRQNVKGKKARRVPRKAKKSKRVRKEVPVVPVPVVNDSNQPIAVLSNIPQVIQRPQTRKTKKKSQEGPLRRSNRLENQPNPTEDILPSFYVFKRSPEYITDGMSLDGDESNDQETNDINFESEPMIQTGEYHFEEQSTPNNPPSALFDDEPMPCPLPVYNDAVISNLPMKDDLGEHYLSTVAFLSNEVREETYQQHQSSEQSCKNSIMVEELNSKRHIPSATLPEDDRIIGNQADPIVVELEYSIKERSKRTWASEKTRRKQKWRCKKINVARLTEEDLKSLGRSSNTPRPVTGQTNRNITPGFQGSKPRIKINKNSIIIKIEQRKKKKKKSKFKIKSEEPFLDGEDDGEPQIAFSIDEGGSSSIPDDDQTNFSVDDDGSSIHGDDIIIFPVDEPSSSLLEDANQADFSILREEEIISLKGNPEENSPVSTSHPEPSGQAGCKNIASFAMTKLEEQATGLCDLEDSSTYKRETNDLREEVSTRRPKIGPKSRTQHLWNQKSPDNLAMIESANNDQNIEQKRIKSDEKNSNEKTPRVGNPYSSEPSSKLDLLLEAASKIESNLDPTLSKGSVNDNCSKVSPTTFHVYRIIQKKSYSGTSKCVCSKSGQRPTPQESGSTQTAVCFECLETKKNVGIEGIDVTRCGNEYFCSICSFKTSKLFQLNDHVVYFHKKCIYECFPCNYNTDQELAFRQHLQECHRDNP